MPKGQFARPFNKDLKAVAKNPSYKGLGLANDVSVAMEKKRKMQARLGGGELNEKSRYDERKGIWK